VQAQEGPEWLRELASTVGGVARVAMSYRETLYPDRKPCVGSQLEAQLREEAGLDEPNTAWGDQVVASAISQAVASLVAAEDQLVCMEHVLREPLTTFGITTLARGVVEACTRAWWLLDPGIDARSRVARYMTDRLETLWEARKLEEVMGAPRVAAARMQDIQTVAERKNFKVVPEGRKSPPAIEQPWPWIVRLVEDILGNRQLGRLVYADVSAVGHGRVHGIVQRLDIVNQLADPTATIQWARANPLKAIGMAVGAAVLAHWAAFGRELELHGWDRAAWHSYTRTAMPIIRRTFDLGQRRDGA
jgi:hypothetical protein